MKRKTFWWVLINDHYRNNRKPYRYVQINSKSIDLQNLICFLLSNYMCTTKRLCWNIISITVHINCLLKIVLWFAFCEYSLHCIIWRLRIFNSWVYLYCLFLIRTYLSFSIQSIFKVQPSSIARIAILLHWILQLKHLLKLRVRESHRNIKSLKNLQNKIDLNLTKIANCCQLFGTRLDFITFTRKESGAKLFICSCN